jgi:hypothetical protein
MLLFSSRPCQKQSAARVVAGRQRAILLHTFSAQIDGGTTVGARSLIAANPEFHQRNACVRQRNNGLTIFCDLFQVGLSRIFADCPLKADFLADSAPATRIDAQKLWVYVET